MSSWPRLKRYYKGLLIRNVRPLSTQGGIEYPAGVIWKVTGYYRGIHASRVYRCSECCTSYTHDVRRFPVDYFEVVKDDLEEMVTL